MSNRSKKNTEKFIKRAMKKYGPKNSKPSHHRADRFSDKSSDKTDRKPRVYAEKIPSPRSRDNIDGKILTGTFSYSGRGFGFVVPTPDECEPEMPDIFIPPRETKGAMTGDVVKVCVTGKSDKGSAEGVVVSAEYSLSSVIGTLHVIPSRHGIPGYSYVTPDKKSLGVIIYIPDKDVQLLSAKDMDKVEVTPSEEPYFTRTKSITVRGPSDMPYFDTIGRISQVFGPSLSREANYSAVLYSAGIRTVFDSRVLEYAENAASEELKIDGRADLRDKNILTIDGAGAKDLDDAISLEKTDSGYILGVHIADVSHYVRQNSPVEEEARLRGTSVYFTDKVVPMLPESLSNGACSLNAGEDKYALSAEITLDNDGRRLGTRIFKSVIRSKVRGVYDEVNDIFENPDSRYREKYAPVLDMLSEMHELYKILKRNQDARGVMELEDSEPIIIVDENSMPVDIIRRERGDAEKLIEQFMLQANMGVAEVLKSLALPCLYRIHEKPSEEKMKSFTIFAHNIGLNTAPAANAKDAKELSDGLMAVLNEARDKGIADTVSEMLLRSMMKAKYESVCSPHFGLGADTYCHFTSPIRRYPDLFVHTVITSVLEGCGIEELSAETEIPKLPATVEKLSAAAEERGKTSTECEITAQNAERDIEDLYMTLYMEPKVGEVFDVVVSSVIRSGMFVRCPNLVEGFIPASTMPQSKINDELMTLYYGGKTYTLGTPLRAKLIEADVSTRKITFILEDYT